MVLLCQQKPASATDPAIALSRRLTRLLLVSLGMGWVALSPAQACETQQDLLKIEAQEDVKRGAKRGAQSLKQDVAGGTERYASPLDLSEITPTQQDELAAVVAERRQILPYRFLSLHRCPSLSNRAIGAFEREDYAGALTLLDQALIEKPSSLTLWLDRAMVHYYLGANAAARADAKQVSRRFNDAEPDRITNAYRQLIIQLEGQAPDPRQALEL